jgi:hypothetical protein
MALAGFVSAFVITTCASTTSPQPGSAFDPVFGTSYGIVPLPPGSRVGVLALFLHNVTSKPVTIRGVRLSVSSLQDVATPLDVPHP